MHASMHTYICMHIHTYMNTHIRALLPHTHILLAPVLHMYTQEMIFPDTFQR